MSIEIKSDILAKELNQGIVPLGVPKAYQYDAALVEAARAAVNQGIDDVAEAGATAKADVNALGDKILAQMKHGYGYPFTAATVAAMTDTAKIYVYTGSESGYTNGNWYYYNGTAWVSGGVYNATALETDKTLAVSGAAADAKVVGDNINNAKKRLINNKIYQSLSGVVDCKLAGSDLFDGTFKWYDNNNILQGEYWSHDATRLRTLPNAANTSQALNYGIRIKQGTIYRYSGLYLYFCVIKNDDGTITLLTEDTSENKSGTFTADKNGLIYLTLSTDSSGKVLHNPSFGENGSAYYSYDSLSYYDTLKELLIKPSFYGKNTIPVDAVNGATWLTQFINPVESVGENNLYYDLSTVNNSVRLAVVNNANSKVIAPILIQKGVTYYYKSIYAYFCIAVYSDGTAERLSQVVVDALDGTFTAPKDGKIYITVSSAYVDSAMFCNGELPLAYTVGAYIRNNKTYVCAKSGGDFHNLVEAINTVSKGFDNTLYVYAGDWDLVQDFTEYYGANTFDESDTTQLPQDIILKNRIKVIFSQNAKVHYELTPSTEYYGKTFTPFKAGAYGFTVKGLNLSVAGARYCFHDERGNSTDAYNNYYENCNFYLDNTNNPFGYIQCVGGGLGTNGNILMKNCTFESKGATTQGIVSYHNTAVTNSRSEIVIKDSYFVNGTVRFSWYGVSTYISKLIVTNCSLASNIIHTAETSESTVQNTEIVEWNNIVRI